jgi:adenine phosphoribosyltransferase
MENLKRLIREVPDYPKPGILFYDITTLLKDAGGLKSVIEGLTESAKSLDVEQVVGIEARGFIFGPCIAQALGVGFVPIRKPKKLPAKFETVTYDLEYGSDSIAVHSDAIEPGRRVLIVDDLLATGGTAAAAVQLVQKLGGEVAGLSFVIELDFLNGRARLPGLRIDSLVHYDS